jgi:hypothetical protein
VCIIAGSRLHHVLLDNDRLFAIDVTADTVGRAWIEALRIDHANHFLGLSAESLNPGRPEQ